MPYNIQVGDEIVEFPDSVSMDQAKDILRKKYKSPPVRPAAQSSPEQGLQQAVQESKKVDSRSFWEKMGESEGGFQNPTESPEVAAQMGKESGKAAATIARYGIPIAAGLATGGSGYLPTALAMSSALGIGEAAAQKIESGKITSPGAVAGSTASGLVPFGKESTSLLGAFAKSGTSQLAAGTVNRATKSLVDTGTVNLSDLASGGAIDFGFGSGLRLGSAVLGGAYRSMANGNRSLAGVVGEIQAPFEAEKIRRIASKLSQFAESGAASDIIGEAAGRIAQASKQDPKAVAEILTSAIKKGQSVDDKQLAQNIIGELQKAGAQLDDRAASAIRDFTGEYELMASKDLSTASNVVKDVANKELSAFKAESRARYAEVESNPLFNEKRIGRVPGEEIYGLSKGKSINDLRDELTKAYSAIDYTKPVQGATFDRYAEVNRVTEQIDKALSELPAGNPVVQKFKDAQKFYNQNMTRFKGRYANSILRDIGEEGGAEASIITNLAGTDGPKYLSELKSVLGNSFGQVRKDIGQQIYSKMSAGGPRKFVENLDKALAGEWGGIQPKVLQEFLPQATPQKVAVARQALEVADNEFSQNFNKAIKEGGDLSSADPESLVSWFNKGGNSSRASKAREYLSGNPKLLDDAQNSLLTQIIADAQVKGAVTGEQIRKVAGEYNNAVTGLMGERGKVKIDDIAKAVDEAAKDASQTSLLSKLMTLTAGAVAGQRTLRATGSVPFTASATLGAAYAASKTIDYANAKIAATLLSNPSYRKAITKPYEELTNRETKMLEEEFPGVIGRIINP